MAALENSSFSSPVASTPRLHTLLWWGMLVLLSLFALWVGSERPLALNDDSFITLTYAKSLAAGEGWRYNGGVESLGTTTPLFALLVAALARLEPGVPIPWLAIWLDVTVWLGAVWLLAAGHRTFRLTRWGGIVAAAALVFPAWLWYPSLGMESPLLVAALLATCWLAARGHAFSAGLLAGALYLIRPEGVAMVPLAGAWLVWHAVESRWRVAARYALGAALPLGLWTLYAWQTFRMLVPNSARAKLGQGQGWPGISFAERAVQEWLPIYAGEFGPSPVFSLVWVLAVVGLAWALRRRSVLLVLVGWTVLFAAVYSLLDAPSYWWYIIPVLVTLQLLCALAVDALLARRETAWRVGGALLGVALVVVWAVSAVNAARTPTGDARAEGYREIAAWMEANAPPGTSLAHVEIGYLGFYSSHPIIDLAGLTDPRLLENANQLDIAANFWLTDPDYILVHPNFGWLLDSILQDPRFEQSYERVAEFEWTAEPAMQLFARKTDR